jgi:hypothetical protein
MGMSRKGDRDEQRAVREPRLRRNQTGDEIAARRAGATLPTVMRNPDTVHHDANAGREFGQFVVWYFGEVGCYLSLSKGAVSLLVKRRGIGTTEMPMRPNGTATLDPIRPNAPKIATVGSGSLISHHWFRDHQPDNRQYRSEHRNTEHEPESEQAMVAIRQGSARLYRLLG